ncbi:hypothetical protein OG992_08835 [Micromonospora sp. NBC_00362]|uniref:hypothetical protein n=1 Tax=Micromonospora sp. NBC_00362 TaxID=2975975 RepID=UPI00225535C9|nr:hypothetical protein [Micromonospora sp. NBC_00362]MCX5117283.1 hypothetical protein [Micromonospora sp. NBC_00362]
MPTRPRPLVAVRLIGPTATVTAHAATIAAQLTAYYGRDRVTCRTSTRPAGYSGESRTYITITLKEARHG